MFAYSARECRRRSEECKRLAEHAENGMCFLYLRMAADWDYLAHSCEKLEWDRTWIAKAQAIVVMSRRGITAVK